MASGPSARPRAFLDISHGADHLGRITFELFVDKTPQTCENFLAICNGQSSALTYKRSIFHRVIEDFMIQGGDITKGDGTGGKSIWGVEFSDENLNWRDIDAPGLLCMANRGKDTNNSQFFITLAECPHLKGRHTVFGHVVSGQNVIDEIAKVSVDSNDRPDLDVIITHCGELERRKAARSGAAAAAENVKPTHDNVEGSQEGRGRRKRRRSKASTSSSSSQTDEGDSHRDSSSTRQPVTKASRRRRSDHEMDEGRRGRPRRMSGARSPSSRTPDEDAMEDDSESGPQDHSPTHKRKRSPSPSRQTRRSRSRSASHEFRRRRSLPNQYDRWRSRQDGQADGHDERHRNRDRRGYDARRDRYDGGQEGRHGRRYEGRHHEGRRQDEGRLGGDPTDDGDGQPRVILKGRGAMKYREPGRF